MSLNSYSIVYNSEYKISNKETLATLSIFYDKILLPANISNYMVEFVLDFQDELYKVKNAKIENGWLVDKSIQSIYEAWDEEQKLLFQEGILQRLEKPNAALLKNISSYYENGELNRLINKFIKIDNQIGNKYILIWRNHLDHLLRSDISIPAIFITKNEHPERELLKSMLVKSVFQYPVQQIPALNSEQILEIRKLVADTREGFSMHLQTLSAEIEERLKEGEDLEDIERYAKTIVETQLHPDYAEFRRQLKAKRSGFWGKVLNITGSILSIDVAPWTPKFYGELIRSMGSALHDEGEHESDRLTNHNQTFQFVKTVENYISDM